MSACFLQYELYFLSLPFTVQYNVMENQNHFLCWVKLHFFEDKTSDDTLENSFHTNDQSPMDVDLYMSQDTSNIELSESHQSHNS